jgi:recombination protein RecA
MARKKKADEQTQETISLSNNKMTANEKRKALDAFAEEINRQGWGLLGRPGNNAELDKLLTLRFIPTPCKEYNDAIGGGFPVGKISIVTGNEDSGKTGMMLATAAKLLEENPDAFVFWVETESSVTDETLEFFHLKDVDRFYFLRLHPKSGAESVIDTIRQGISNGLVDLVVINSLKMLIPEVEKDKPMSKVDVATQARFNSKMMQKLSNVCDINNCAMVLIQHLTTNIGQMYGNPKTLAGGLAIRYAALLIVEHSSVSIDANDPVTPATGKKFAVRVRKNHCVWGRNPYVTTNYFVEYATGIEQIYSTLNLLIENGIIEKRGAWLKHYDNEGNEVPEFAWNGKQAFKKDMLENPDKLETLLSLIHGDTSLVHDMTEDEAAEMKADEETDALTIKNLLELEEAEDK